MRKICFLGLGSNEPTNCYILKAQTLLRGLFPDIVFDRLQRTAPVDFICDRLFFNQVAKCTTSLNKENMIAILKETEKILGRKPEDKQQGIVRIDIDLLIYDGERLKFKELQRNDILDGLKRLTTSRNNKSR